MNRLRIWLIHLLGGYAITDREFLDLKYAAIASRMAEDWEMEEVAQILADAGYRVETPRAQKSKQGKAPVIKDCVITGNVGNGIVLG